MISNIKLDLSYASTYFCEECGRETLASQIDLSNNLESMICIDCNK